VEKKTIKVDLSEWVDKVVYEDGKMVMYVDERDWEEVKDMFGSTEQRCCYHRSEGGG